MVAPSHVRVVGEPREVEAAAAEMRAIASGPTPEPREVVEALHGVGEALQSVATAPGAGFLRLWFRRATLLPLVERELGTGWHGDAAARLRAFPIGVIGHFPAANVEVQPILSASVGLVTGNTNLVRVPPALAPLSEAILAAAAAAGPNPLSERARWLTFASERTDLLEAMARGSDGAAIWGGREAVLAVRSLPFPHWARIVTYGPRISVAMLDRGSWTDPTAATRWAKRISRDTWQFEQAACSSPQALFLECGADEDPTAFVETLQAALVEENRLHPRRELEPATAAHIAAARAQWLLGDGERSARFPAEPDWTLLVGRGEVVPEPIQGRTLHVLASSDLRRVAAGFDGHVQTLGLGMADPGLEAELADLAGRRGVDRIVKLGQMHLFDSPWDGHPMLSSMVRWVRHVPAAEPPRSPKE